jgi:hypothetical protein
MRKDRRQSREFKPGHELELEERISLSNANFPPGQFPSSGGSTAPGQSNPNETPATKLSYY